MKKKLFDKLFGGSSGLVNIENLFNMKTGIKGNVNANIDAKIDMNVNEGISKLYKIVKKVCIIGLILFIVGLIGYGIAKYVVRHNNVLQLSAQELVVGDFTGTEGNGQVTLKPNSEELKKYSADERDRINGLAEKTNITLEESEGLSSGDTVDVSMTVPKEVLREENVELNDTAFELTVPELLTEEEKFEAENKKDQEQADSKLEEYIALETTDSSHYSDPISLGMRESTSCGYKVFDYSAEESGDKVYFSVIVPSDGSEIQVETKIYSDSLCGIESSEQGPVLVDFTSTEIDMDIVSQLQNIASEEVNSYISVETTDRTHYSDVAFAEANVAKGSQSIVFTYSATENTSYATYDAYLYVYINDVYVEDGKVIDYHVEPISEQSKEGLSLEEAYGLEFTESDQVAPLE